MTVRVVQPMVSETAAPRRVGRAAYRGLTCRCPNCGDGRMFQGYATAKSKCSVCGERLDGHRADDLPAYLTIVIAGKASITVLLWAILHTDLPNWALYLGGTLGASALALALLRPLKGMVIGLQWAWRLHGFDPNASDAPETASALESRP